MEVKRRKEPLASRNIQQVDSGIRVRLWNMILSFCRLKERIEKQSLSIKKLIMSPKKCLKRKMKLFIKH
ncbi:hypothetical protein DF185_18790 [Marinifilum breve]|uniref:Uncharacterized protein n=1 Tax=Marinifilum breve TaxID=2184082 RepID=A0A2V4A6Q4_9BACT|nr:hypothetical protein DF185_18790 [Marinifilum breve]